MEHKGIAGIRGWLLVYVIGSIPVMLFYSAGLSGWVLDYPVWLMTVIFLIFAAPLVLVLRKFPKAPQWNITLVWIASSLIIVRIIFGILFQSVIEDRPPASREELVDAMPILVGIIVFSLAWAIIWTVYFKKSRRVRNTLKIEVSSKAA